MRLADKVAIVTGAGTGIGAAIATTFAREGAKVTLTGRRKETLGEIAAAGGRALAVPGSVTQRGRRSARCAGDPRHVRARRRAGQQRRKPVARRSAARDGR